MIVVGGDVPRVPGDVGCAASFDRPVGFERAGPVSMQDVFDGREHALLPALLRAGRALVGRGATVLATTCGLLTRVHRELTDRLGVPVATSALLQLPQVLAVLPAGRTVGVVTALAAQLTPERLVAAGVAPDRLDRIVTIDLAATDHFLPALRGERDSLDLARAEQEIRAVVARAVEGTAVGALVSECANLPPYSAALRAATGLPVWDALDQIRWLAAGGGAPSRPA
ncbi:aspartate/glutamate racemase family protein [Pseudonocardia sp. C8]|uniref:aspartate/glutamate racemase family protein n=1 Tax=Pseudonocardia sp. C8 TaxID=2762759 RepID=UPI00351C38A6